LEAFSRRSGFFTCPKALLWPQQLSTETCLHDAKGIRTAKFGLVPNNYCLPLAHLAVPSLDGIRSHRAMGKGIANEIAHGNFDRIETVVRQSCFIELGNALNSNVTFPNNGIRVQSEWSKMTVAIIVIQLDKGDSKRDERDQ
jgi:hypothetical protein